MRGILLEPTNLRVQVIADLNALPNPGEPWHSFLPAKYNNPKYEARPYVNAAADLKVAVANKNQSMGAITGVGGLESAYLFHSVLLESHPNIHSPYMDLDYPALLVLIKYLTAMEGPFWKEIRGRGLAYGYEILPMPEESTICFQLYKSADLQPAFQASRDIIQRLSNGQTAFEKTALDAAKSSMIYQIISQEKSIYHAASEAFISYLKKLEGGNEILVRRVQGVTEEDLKRVLERHLRRLFEISDQVSSQTAIAVSPNRVQSVTQQFAELNLNLIHVPNMLNFSNEQ